MEHLRSIPRSARRPRLPTLIILIGGLLLPFSGPRADMVYGRVYGAEGEFRGGDTFVVIAESEKADLSKGKKVKTDENKGFSVWLPPGRYEVVFKNWTAVIESYPQPVRQDIQLTKRKD